MKTLEQSFKRHLLKCKSNKICRCTGIYIADQSLSFKLCFISFIFFVICYCMEFEFCHMDYFFNPYLLAINDIMKAHKIKAYLFFGPLLGLIRAQKLMPWDYDIDFGIDSEHSSALLSLRPQFELLGFQVYGRGEFIWHKLGGDTFQITLPVLRLYTPPSPLIRYHIEFYETHDETVASAKTKGYDLNDALQLLDNDAMLSCIAPEEPCFEKGKIFPLTIWNANDFGVDFLIPNDTEYCLTQLYGANWRIPVIKGWKSVICYEEWSPATVTYFKFVVVCWYLALSMLYLYQKYINKTTKQVQILHESEKEHLMAIDLSQNNKHI